MPTQIRCFAQSMINADVRPHPRSVPDVHRPVPNPEAALALKLSHKSPEMRPKI